jgi:hypothetical protein
MINRYKIVQRNTEFLKETASIRMWLQATNMRRNKTQPWHTQHLIWKEKVSKEDRNVV